MEKKDEFPNKFWRSSKVNLEGGIGAGPGAVPSHKVFNYNNLRI
jgi:hypothetical protein